LLFLKRDKKPDQDCYFAGVAKHKESVGGYKRINKLSIYGTGRVVERDNKVGSSE